MKTDFTSATNTIIVSDVHLTEAEAPNPENPLWKRFKHSDLFVDESFKNLLDHMQATVTGPLELICNGDIFDFDSVMRFPEDGRFSVSWLEWKRGLAAEEPKSAYKVATILEDHPMWVGALRDFLRAGHRIVFVIGNHDMELHWPAVQAEILGRLAPGGEHADSVRFCEWFYISNGDTLVEHGNQYDAYCVCANPVHPLIQKPTGVVVRLPFGDLAGKYMLNGMGLFNPHVESSFIRGSLVEYLTFFRKYLLRTQPFLVWTWFWGAMVTLVQSVWEGMLPAMRDPLTVEARVEDIAQRSNATPRVVRALKEVHAHPVFFNPLRIMRELWLDRALLFVVLLFGTFQFFSFINVFVTVSLWWFIVPFAILMPGFIFYARSVSSEVYRLQKDAQRNLALSVKIAGVRRVVQGHTHREQHAELDGIELLNTGSWSSAYLDVECTLPLGRKCFAWLKPSPDGQGRVAELHEWKNPGSVALARERVHTHITPDTVTDPGIVTDPVGQNVVPLVRPDERPPAAGAA